MNYIKIGNTSFNVDKINFKTRSEFINKYKGKKKSDFWTQELLEYVNKKFQEFYLLETQKDQTLDDDLGETT